MRFTRAVCAFLCLVLVFPFSACGVRKLGAGSVDSYGTGGTLKPDDPAETGGVMRRSEEELAEQTPGTLDTPGNVHPEVVVPPRHESDIESSPSKDAQTGKETTKPETPAEPEPPAPVQPESFSAR